MHQKKLLKQKNNLIKVWTFPLIYGILIVIEPYDVGVVCGDCNEDIDVDEVGIKFK